MEQKEFLEPKNKTKQSQKNKIEKYFEILDCTNIITKNSTTAQTAY